MKDIKSIIGQCRCGKKFNRYNTIDKDCPNCKFKKLTANKQKRGVNELSDKETDKDTTPTFFNRGGQKTKPKRKKSELTKAKDRAWMWFSRYIRLKHSNNGVCKCITCGAYHGILNIDAGHWISRSHLTTLYHPDNVRPQCKSENRFQQGKSFEFEQALLREIGEERVNNLKETAKLTGSDTIIYHMTIESKYKQLVNDIQKETGKKYW